uniref:SFRICE_013465 n=1 Tax=Spodoptera frugiperda TaxID=7108 RepID=A0A2H1WVW0_SPOFR
MVFNKLGLTVCIILLISIQEISSTKDENTTQLEEKSKPLESLILKENEPEGVSHKKDDKDVSTRVKRQYYDPYYPYYRRRVPIPVPIIIGGGFGGFGRGFGRGFGGRGFGGRGFGGRGFGGRGFGGFGGRGGFGGFGGRGGRG